MSWQPSLPSIAGDALGRACRGALAERLIAYPDERQLSAACFVTITRDHELRGCVGSVEPMTPRLVEEVQRNAIRAGFADPRMRPVTAEELDRLEYKIDILGALTPVQDLDELDPRCYGLLLRHPRGGALLLPDIEDVDTPERQLRSLIRKAGLDRLDSLSRLWRFPVTRHHQDGRVVATAATELLP